MASPPKLTRATGTSASTAQPSRASTPLLPSRPATPTVSLAFAGSSSTPPPRTSSYPASTSSSHPLPSLLTTSSRTRLKPSLSSLSSASSSRPDTPDGAGEPSSLRKSGSRLLLDDDGSEVGSVYGEGSDARLSKASGIGQTTVTGVVDGSDWGRPDIQVYNPADEELRSDLGKEQGEARPGYNKGKGKEKEGSGEGGSSRQGGNEDVTGSEEASGALGDPRDVLRAQLLKSSSKRKVVSATSSDLTRPPPHPPETGSILDLALDSMSTETRYEPRRYFILTSAGKPVWTSGEGEQEDATEFVGIMQAIISIYANEGDKLRYIDAGKMRISFFLRSPLYFVCVSSWGEPESVLRMQLEYLHLQILSVIPNSQLQRIFEKRSNFDLRRMLEGTENLISSLVKAMQTDFSFLTGSLEVFRVAPNLREQVAAAINPPPSTKDLLYALVVAGGKVVTLLRPKKHSIHPSDLHILVNTVLASTSLRSSECWLPICLPRFNSTGFLHAYVSFLSEDVGLVFVSGNKEGFFDMRDWRETVNEKLDKSGALEKLEKAIPTQGYSAGELGVAGLRHFVYKSRSLFQITSPVWDRLYEEETNRLRLVTLYQRVYDALHVRAPVTNHGKQPVKMVYLRTQHEAVVGWITQAFEVFLSLPPLLSKQAAVAAAHAVAKWVKQEEAGIFLNSAPSF